MIIKTTFYEEFLLVCLIKLLIGMRGSQLKEQDNHNRSVSYQKGSTSDLSTLKKTVLVQEKLKKEIKNKFNKNTRQD